jgi:hypothetical protein
MICGSRCLPHVPPRVLPKFVAGAVWLADAPRRPCPVRLTLRSAIPLIRQ